MDQKQAINGDLKKALLEGDKERASVLRGLKSVILNAEIAAGKRETGLNETETAALLQKEIKSRKESAELYKKGNETSRAEQELAEVKVIENYLPQQISDQKLDVFIDQAIQEIGDATPQAMGQIIGKVKQQTGSGADGARIAAAVKEKISA